MRRQTREIVFIGYTYPYTILVFVNLCLTKNTFLKILSRFVQWFRKDWLQIFNSLRHIQFASVPQQLFLCKLRLGLPHYYVNLNMRSWASHVLRGGLWNQIIASCFSQKQVYRRPSLRIITNTQCLYSCSGLSNFSGKKIPPFIELLAFFWPRIRNSGGSC